MAGLGCGCVLCRQPVPNPEIVGKLDTALMYVKYKAEREAWRVANGIPKGGWRNTKKNG